MSLQLTSQIEGLVNQGVNVYLDDKKKLLDICFEIGRLLVDQKLALNKITREQRFMEIIKGLPETQFEELFTQVVNQHNYNMCEVIDSKP
jgi:hypothetical protein